MPLSTSSSRAARTDAVREAERELDAWRGRAIPDRAAPLEADDVARLVRDCLATVGLADAGQDFSVNTVHYYRRKDILDAPEGRTSAARYAVRHLWQAAGARLAGQLGLLTLAEARDAMRGASEGSLLRFVAERVTDARARRAVRDVAAAPLVARPLTAVARSSDAPPGAAAVVLQLPGDAWCVVPASHPARHSAEAARALGRALSDALRTRRS